MINPGKHVSDEISSSLQKKSSGINHHLLQIILRANYHFVLVCQPIRNNDATELCITKEQEGHVVGLQAGRGIHGQLVLNTLFIKLDNLQRW